jgi:hypothetical protein
MISYKQVNLQTEMATTTHAQLLSKRAQENLKIDNDFQKFVDVSPGFLIEYTIAKILTSSQ